MELLRNGLKLVAVQGLDDSEGSVNVPVKLVHNSDDQYVNFTEQLHIRYINDGKAFEEILPSKDSEFYIPGKVFVESGPIQLAVHLINGDVERVTNELQFVVKKAPNGKTLVDPSEFSWQQLVDQYVSAKLETFADKADMNEFKNGINANLTNQDKKITDLQTSTKFDLDSQSTKINDITSTQNSKIAILESRMSTFTSLKEGSTTGDAELIDARIGADGTKYPSAGDAMRGQIEQLNKDLENYIYKPTLADNNKFPRAKDGNVEWVEQGMPTDEQTSNAINNWLNAHPEATTTVLDESLTESKFTNDLKLHTLKDYITPEMFGAKGDGSTDDTSALQRAIDKSVETKKDIVLKNKTYLTTQPLQIQEKITMRGISYADEYYGQACIKNNLTNIFVSKTSALEAGIKFLNIRFVGNQNFIANANFNWSQIRHCGFVGFSKVFESTTFLGCWLTDLFINNIKTIGTLGGSDNNFNNWFINGHSATQGNNEPLITVYGCSLSRFTNIYCTGVEVSEQNTYGSNIVLFIDGYTENLVFDHCWFDYANDVLIKIRGRDNDAPKSIANNITFNQCCIRGGCLKVRSSYIDADLCSGITFNQCFFDKHHTDVPSVDGYTVFNIGNTLVRGFFNNNNTYMIPRTVSGNKESISELFLSTNSSNPKPINSGVGISGAIKNNIYLQNARIEYRKQKVTTDSTYGSFTIYSNANASESVILAMPVLNDAVCCLNNATDNSAEFILRSIQSGAALPSREVTVMLFIIYFKGNNWGTL